MPELTRRAFMHLFSGALATLPTLGGVLLAPRPALADPDVAGSKDAEATAVDPDSNWVTIDVVAPYEVGLIVYDVTKVTYDESGLPVYEGAYLGGAKVKVTSRYNGQVAEGTTVTDGEGTGVCKLYIRHLFHLYLARHIFRSIFYHSLFLCHSLYILVYCRFHMVFHIVYNT